MLHASKDGLITSAQLSAAHNAGLNRPEPHSFPPTGIVRDRIVFRRSFHHPQHRLPLCFIPGISHKVR